MRNIVATDISRTPYELAYCNEGNNENEIELLFEIPVITNPYLEITKQDGTIEATSILKIDNSQISCKLPFDTYSATGTIKIRVIAEDYESEYISLNIPTTLKETDNIIVKLNSSEDTYLIRKITQSTTNEVMSFAEMETTTNSNSYSADNVDVRTGIWQKYLEQGDFYCDIENSRLVIPAGTAEYIQISATIAGCGKVCGRLRLVDGGTNRNWTFLHQPESNSYFSFSYSSQIIKIRNPDQDAYVYLVAGGYNSVSWQMNAGVGVGGTNIRVQKILPTNIVQSSTTTTTASNVVIKRW